jgi:hypothetical protein
MELLMNQYFRQLNLPIKKFTVEELQPVRHKAWFNSYCDIGNLEARDYLMNVFKELEPYNVVLAEFTNAVPHIDGKEILCAINHYYTTLDAKTVFFELKDQKMPPYDEHFQGVWNPYHEEDLIEQAKFKADENDIWLINVAKPHKLSIPIINQPPRDWKPGPNLRNFVKWQFKIPYDVIYAKLFKD